MPRPMLRVQEKNKSETNLNQMLQPNTQRIQSEAEKIRLDRLLRKKRSKQYIEAIHELDAGGHVMNQSKVDEIINKISLEFPELEMSGILLGYVSKCYLGKPYEVHTLDIIGGIIEHYKAGQPLPDGLEKARGIALHGGYAFIEVYSDCCRAVSEDGTVAVIPS
ncbi:hypothetical protein [Anaerovibrio lipolyticus]|uniref:hypothetical protein n=1 Tax=Anaerovibrio lipolyticus TaxID=82374 RepID=UPI00048767CF|nr:hypothetical protein [Anaerovibrio lipolyticus]